jgi:hypothetical protein
MTTAFLKEEYMRQPEGFDDVSGRVYKLKQSLYGLKQAPGRWNQRLVYFMRKRRLKISPAGPYLFVCQHNGRKLTVAFCMDDGLLTQIDEVRSMCLLISCVVTSWS